MSTVNHARAMRIAEIMTDFGTLQREIASIRVVLARGDHNLEGYVLLRQAVHEAQAALTQPFGATVVSPRGNEEQEKTQLRQ